LGNDNKSILDSKIFPFKISSPSLLNAKRKYSYFLNDRIYEVGDRMSLSGRYGYSKLLVPGFAVIPANNVHLPPGSRAPVFALRARGGVHVDADGLVGASLEINDPVVSAVLEDDLSNKVNRPDDAIWIASPLSVGVTDGVEIP
jgi:hypothetical protein